VYSFLEWYATYERIVFEGGTDRTRPENAVLVRAQLAF